LQSSTNYAYFFQNRILLQTKLFSFFNVIFVLSYIKLYIVKGLIMTFPCLQIIYFGHVHCSITLSYLPSFLFPFLFHLSSSPPLFHGLGCFVSPLHSTAERKHVMLVFVEPAYFT
jgi:hypothetical protein